MLLREHKDSWTRRREQQQQERHDGTGQDILYNHPRCVHLLATSTLQQLHRTLFLCAGATPPAPAGGGAAITHKQQRGIANSNQRQRHVHEVVPVTTCDQHAVVLALSRARLPSGPRGLRDLPTKGESPVFADISGISLSTLLPDSDSSAPHTLSPNHIHSIHYPTSLPLHHPIMSDMLVSPRAAPMQRSISADASLPSSPQAPPSAAASNPVSPNSLYPLVRRPSCLVRAMSTRSTSSSSSNTSSRSVRFCEKLPNVKFTYPKEVYDRVGMLLQSDVSLLNSDLAGSDHRDRRSRPQALPRDAG